MLAPLLSIRRRALPAPAFNPKSKKERSFGLLLRLIDESWSHEQPLLILFEDVHWIDPTTQELVDRTVQRIADHPGATNTTI